MAKFDSLSDQDFKNIIENSKTWKEIAINFGYTNVMSQQLKDKIRNRCEILEIQCLEKLIKPSVKEQTKGNLFNNRKNWQSARSAIRRDAEKVFNNSDKAKKCAICGYDKHVEIAHIKAVSDFEDSAIIAEINSIDNLIALCPNHHWEYDNGIINL